MDESFWSHALTRRPHCPLWKHFLDLFMGKFLSTSLVCFNFANCPGKKKGLPSSWMTVSLQLLLLWWGVAWCSHQCASTYCMMPFLFKFKVVAKPIICNHGNNSRVMPLIKSCSSPGVPGTGPMFVQKSQGQTLFAATHFSWKTVSGFPASTSAVKREAPLRISCWNPMWHL